MELWVVFLFIILSQFLLSVKKDFMSRFAGLFFAFLIGLFTIVEGITTNYSLFLEPLPSEVVLISPGSLHAILIFLLIALTSLAQMLDLFGRRR